MKQMILALLAVSVEGNLTVGGAIKPENATRFERKMGYTAKMSDS